MHAVTRFRQKRRLEIITYLGGVCTHCGTSENLEIDHIDPSTKSFTLSGNNLNRTWKYLLPEIKKCQLLCKPHHIEKTKLELKGKVPWNKNCNPYIHGTPRMYNECKCKCDGCKLAKKLYRSKQLSYTDHYSVLAL